MLRPDPPYSPAKEPPPKNTLNMSLRFTIPLRIHKSSFVRSKIRTRLKTGISLIVIRRACVEVDAEGKKRLISQDDGEDEKKWIMKGKSIIFIAVYCNKLRCFHRLDLRLFAITRSLSHAICRYD